jgi:hypothetical protein
VPVCVRVRVRVRVWVCVCVCALRVCPVLACPPDGFLSSLSVSWLGSHSWLGLLVCSPYSLTDHLLEGKDNLFLHPLTVRLAGLLLVAPFFKREYRRKDFAKKTEIGMGYSR